MSSSRLFRCFRMIAIISCKFTAINTIIAAALKLYSALSEKIAHSTVYLHLSDSWAVITQLDYWLRWWYTVEWAVSSESVESKDVRIFGHCFSTSTEVPDRFPAKCIWIVLIISVVLKNKPLSRCQNPIFFSGLAYHEWFIIFWLSSLCNAWVRISVYTEIVWDPEGGAFPGRLRWKDPPSSGWQI